MEQTVEDFSIGLMLWQLGIAAALLTAGFFLMKYVSRKMKENR